MCSAPTSTSTADQPIILSAFTVKWVNLKSFWHQEDRSVQKIHTLTLEKTPVKNGFFGFQPGRRSDSNSHSHSWCHVCWIQVTRLVLILGVLFLCHHLTCCSRRGSVPFCAEARGMVTFVYFVMPTKKAQSNSINEWWHVQYSTSFGCVYIL